MVLGTVRSVLFGSAVRIGATAVLSLVVIGGGAFAAGIIGVPALESVDNEFGDVNETHTEIRTNLTIDNPNPIGASSADVSAEYVVSMNEIEMAQGSGDEFDVAPGRSTETLTTQMRNERIPEWWASHVANGERTEVEIDATITSGVLGRSTDVTDTRTIETDIISEFDSDETRPVDANAPLVEDPVLYVNATRANWGDVDAEHTDLDLRFDMYNPKRFDIPVSRIGYTIYMNDVVVGEGETDREHVLRSGRVTEVETETRIDNENLDEWWVTHVENDQVTELRIEFNARVEVAGTTITLPLDALTYEETIETDIWGEEDSNGSADADETSDGAGSSDGSGSDDETDSSDATESSETGGDGSDGTDDGDGSAGDGDGVLPGVPLAAA